MTCWPVSPRAGNVKNNDPSLKSSRLPSMNLHRARNFDRLADAAGSTVRQQTCLPSIASKQGWLKAARRDPGVRQKVVNVSLAP